MIRFRPKLFALALAGGVALYFLVFYMASHGEPFRSFVSWSRTSVEFGERFGVIQDVRLTFFGSYHERTRGESGSAKFVAVVTGSRAADKVNVEMRLKEGGWSVEQVTGSGGDHIVDSPAVRP